MSSSQRTRTRAAYTLVELMIVVTILGILATIAVPTYKGYVMRSKATEAISFLSEIKQRQEAYRADFRQYLSVSAAADDWFPDDEPNDTNRAWPPTNARWNMLGAQPRSRTTYFSYVTLAGPPGTTPTLFGLGSMGYAGDDYWFIARALGDLDNDGNTITFEAYSESQNIWESNRSGWE